MKTKIIRKGLLLLFTVFIFHFHLSAQRKVDLKMEALVSPDTVFRGVKPLLRYWMSNLGPDSIYKTDTILTVYNFDPYWGPSVKFPNYNREGKDWYKYPFPKNLGQGDTLWISWQCPSMFNIPSTRVAELSVACTFVSGAINKAEDEVNYLNNSINRTDIVYYFPAAGVQAIRNPDCLLYPNPLNQNESIKLDNSENKIRRIVLTNVNGEVIYTCSELSKGILELNLNELNLDSGVYQIQLETNDGLITQKIIK